MSSSRLESIGSCAEVGLEAEVKRVPADSSRWLATSTGNAGGPALIF